MPDRDAPTLGVGMVGYAFMGAAHSQAWRTAGRVLRPAGSAPGMVAVWAGTRQAGGRGGRELGWAEVETDWRS